MSDEKQIYTLDIAGFLDAEGTRYEASIENTITGVRWTLRGNLAKAVQLLIEAERERCAQIAAKAERRILDDKGGMVPIMGRTIIAKAIRHTS